MNLGPSSPYERWKLLCLRSFLVLHRGQIIAQKQMCRGILFYLLYFFGKIFFFTFDLDPMFWEQPSYSVAIHHPSSYIHIMLTLLVWSQCLKNVKKLLWTSFFWGFSHVFHGSRLVRTSYLFSSPSSPAWSDSLRCANTCSSGNESLTTRPGVKFLKAAGFIRIIRMHSSTPLKIFRIRTILDVIEAFKCHKRSSDLIFLAQLMTW